MVITISYKEFTNSYSNYQPAFQDKVKCVTDMQSAIKALDYICKNPNVNSATIEVRK